MTGTASGHRAQSRHNVVWYWHSDMRDLLIAAPLAARRHHEASRLKLEIRDCQSGDLIHTGASRGQDQHQGAEVVVLGKGGFHQPSHVSVTEDLLWPCTIWFRRRAEPVPKGG